MRIIHVWDAYAPSLFDRTHPYLLNHPEHASMLLAANLIENDSTVLPNSFFLARRAVDDDILPPLWVRARRRLRREFAEALRRLARSSAATSIWSTAPLTLSLFNRFCLAHAREFHGDLIHAHFGTTGVMTLPFIRATGLPAIVTFYGVDGSASLRIPSWRENFKEMFTRMDRVLVLCDAVRERLLAIGCPPQKLIVWNLPAGIEQYPYRPRSTTGKAVRFLIAARFVEKKGHRYLIDAFGSIVRAGVDARLTMIGYGPFKGAIEEAVRGHGLSDRVTIVDTQLTSSFSEIYREALDDHDIFVLPSTTGVNGDDEGGPALTMICAQAAGLPAICTPFPGAERSVVDGVTGLFCRQDDAGSLAERMQWLAAHREAWNAIGKVGSDRVRTNFSLNGQMDALLGIYRDVIDEAHGTKR